MKSVKGRQCLTHPSLAPWQVSPSLSAVHLFSVRQGEKQLSLSYQSTGSREWHLAVLSTVTHEAWNEGWVTLFL